MKIKSLLEDTNVKAICNTKAAKGCFVEVVRGVGDKSIISQFVTHYATGRTISEPNDFKCKLMESDSEFWEEYKVSKVKDKEEESKDASSSSSSSSSSNKKSAYRK